MGDLKYMVVVLPGIGGSVLSAPDGSLAWDVTLPRIAGAIVGPAALDIDRELIPTALTSTLTVLSPWLVAPGYDGLTHHLWTRFGVGTSVHDYRAGQPIPPNVDVLRVPYDFRRSVAEAADVVGRAVAAATGRDSDRQVVVVAHSLGGLVARYWIGVCGGWRHCRALITLGTPHRGAPRALDWLFNGAGVGPLRSAAATRVLRSWPSVYELLPQYPAVLSESKKPMEVQQLSPALVRTFGSPTAGVSVLGRAAEADLVHRAITDGWEALRDDQRPGLVCYFGRGHSTVNRAVVNGDRVRFSKDDPEWRGNVGWLGDGTVPAISGIPVEWSAEPERAQALPERHGAMGSTPAVIERLVTLQGGHLPLRGGQQPERPWLGWDVEEVVAAGAEFEVGVWVQPGATGPQEVTGRAASITVTGGPTRIGPLSMAFGERGWRALLPSLPVGLYHLDVEVKDAWNGMSLFAETVPIAAVDANTEGGS